MARNPLAAYGYPSNKQLRNQAGIIADASVPSVKATTKPYNEQHQSVAGFLAGVLSALGESSGDVGRAYSDAQAQQSAINTAAAQRLASLGLGDYSAGVSAAQGARGDSALANLLASGAAAQAYMGKQPGIATGYAQTQNSAINRALSDALTQRSTAWSQAFAQALQQQQQNALQMADFVAGRRDAAAQLALSRQQLALSQAQFGESVREFNASQKQDWQKFLMSQAGVGSKKQSAWAKLTPGQQQAQLADIADSVNDSIKGVPNPNYGGTKPGTNSRDNAHWILKPGQKTPLDVYNDLRAHGYSQYAILQTFQRVYKPEEFQFFMAKKFPSAYNRIWGKTVTTPPGYQH